MKVFLWHPGVNFTNILWAAFVPKSFCQKITNPNCKRLKAVQRTLVWLSISPIFYKQLFHTKVLCAPFMCLQFGFVIFWRKDFGAKAAHKMLVKLTPGYQRCSLFKWSFNGKRSFIILAAVLFHQQRNQEAARKAIWIRIEEAEFVFQYGINFWRKICCLFLFKKVCFAVKKIIC